MQPNVHKMNVWWTYAENMVEKNVCWNNVINYAFGGSI